MFSWDSEKKDRDRVSKLLENFGFGMREDGDVHARESEDCVVPQERHHASVHLNGFLYNKVAHMPLAVARGKERGCGLY